MNGKLCANLKSGRGAIGYNYKIIYWKYKNINIPLCSDWLKNVWKLRLICLSIYYFFCAHVSYGRGWHGFSTKLVI